ncbi:MAG: hypothetical protein ACFB2Z_05520 [Maricaulaceae bacterium]
MREIAEISSARGTPNARQKIYDLSVRASDLAQESDAPALDRAQIAWIRGSAAESLRLWADAAVAYKNACFMPWPRPWGQGFRACVQGSMALLHIGDEKRSKALLERGFPLMATIDPRAWNGRTRDFMTLLGRQEALAAYFNGLDEDWVQARGAAQGALNWFFKAGMVGGYEPALAALA